MKYSVCVQMLKRVLVEADSEEEACDIVTTLLQPEYPDWDVYADEEDVRKEK